MWISDTKGLKEEKNLKLKTFKTLQYNYYMYL